VVDRTLQKVLIDAPATAEQRRVLEKLSPDMVGAMELGGEPILAKLIRAPWNDAPIGGLKVVTEHSWFAARPSGTEDIYKVYVESLKGEDHLLRVQEEAQALIRDVFARAGVK
jgi:phosphoglucomutase